MEIVDPYFWLIKVWFKILVVITVLIDYYASYVLDEIRKHAFALSDVKVIRSCYIDGQLMAFNFMDFCFFCPFPSLIVCSLFLWQNLFGWSNANWV